MILFYNTYEKNFKGGLIIIFSIDFGVNHHQ
jgi:hypothetical protein